jgi:HAD superfamily hydrolase (TIGR01662 family)
MSEAVIICGFPASTKSTVAKEYARKGFATLNRDTEGGTIAGLLPKFDSLLGDNKSVVLDNLFPTSASRAPFIDLAKKHGTPIHCVVMKTSIENSMFNFLNRMLISEGRLLTPYEIQKSKKPSIFPPAVFFKHKKEFQAPTVAEGFASVTERDFVRQDDPTFTNKALIVDYDGTLRECVGGNGMFPTEEKHIQLKANVKRVLRDYQDRGYRLLGVSNQSGVHKGDLTADKAQALFQHTNKLLGLDIEVVFCPHQAAPPNCYCRKPQVGNFVDLMHRHKLDRKACIYVGDQTTDQTFAKRVGMPYVDQAEFFK